MSDTIQDESPRTLHLRYIILPAILLGAWALYAFLVYTVFNMEFSKSSDGFIISVMVSCLMALGWLPLTALILDALELPHLGRILAKIRSWLGEHW